MFPVRCVVECVSEGECVKCGEHGAVVADSFAIVAGQTPLSQLVETVLTALGFQHLSSGAKAWIQVKNWKPLSFDQITDDPDVEIEYLLKDVSNQLTLRILTKQSDAAVLDCARDMKDRLFKVLLRKMPKLLHEASKFHPQLKDLLTQLVEGDGAPAAIDAEQMHHFNAWLDEFSQSHGPRLGAPADRCPPNSSPGAARFSPMLEVPKLERWFRENPNPSRQKLQYYMQMLNGSNFRKHAGKITYQQICNWFSNARASHRKKDGDQVQADRRGPGSSAESGGPGTHWVSKVFSNNVRNLSIAFNDFIHSAPKLARVDGVVAVNVPNGATSPPARGHQPGPSTPSADTSSTSSQSPTARTAPAAREEVLMDCGDDEDEETRMRIVEGGSADDPSITVGAVLKAAINDGLPSMAGRLPICPSTSPSSPSTSAVINRTRLMFDPLTELPLLEKWFEENPHPSWAQVDHYTEQLNSLSYRQTYPPVSAHNLKIWFKNRRAKCKRLMNGNADGSLSAITVKSETT